MNLLKRISTSFVARVDKLVGDIENHEAVIEAAMNDMKKHVAKAKVNMLRLSNEKKQFEDSIKQSNDGAKQWQQRAIACASSDEAKALECLARRRFLIDKAKRSQKNVNLLNKNIQRLSDDIQASEDRIAETRQKLALLNAKKSTNQVRIVSENMPKNINNLLEETLIDWEEKLTFNDYLQQDNIVLADEFEESFIEKENKAELAAELSELLKQENRHEN